MRLFISIICKNESVRQKFFLYLETMQNILNYNDTNFQITILDLDVDSTLFKTCNYSWREILVPLGYIE